MSIGWSGFEKTKRKGSICTVEDRLESEGDELRTSEREGHGDGTGDNKPRRKASCCLICSPAAFRPIWPSSSVSVNARTKNETYVG